MNEALTPYPSPLMGRGGLNQRFPKKKEEGPPRIPQSDLMNEALTPYPSPLMGRGGLNQRFPKKKGEGPPQIPQSER